MEFQIFYGMGGKLPGHHSVGIDSLSQSTAYMYKANNS